MRIYLTSTEGLEELKNNIETNLPIYRGEGSFRDLKITRRNYIDIHGSFVGIDLNNGAKSDAKNAKIIFDALNKISPDIARREELWTSLTHGDLFEYSRSRWKVPVDNDQKAIAYVKSHFFADGHRLIESRNAVSRLYWGGRLASRVKNHSMEDVLDTLFSLSDFRLNFVERPSIIQSGTLFSAVMSQMIESMNGDAVLTDRDTNREFLKEVNHLFGNLAIECLSQQKVDSLVAGVADEIRERYSAAPAMAC